MELCIARYIINIFHCHDCVTFLSCYRKRKHKDIKRYEQRSSDETDQPERVTELSPERLNQNGLNITDGNTKVKKKKNKVKHSRGKEGAKTF